MKRIPTVLVILGVILGGLGYLVFTHMLSSSSSGYRGEDMGQMHTALSPEVYHIMYEKGTEPAFSSALNDEHRKGTFVTADTGLPVYRSEDKFDSGTGWPSFTRPISGSVELREDKSLFTTRTEIVSVDTGAHLGHVFNDGPPPTGMRYCMNGLALRFIPDEQAE